MRKTTYRHFNLAPVAAAALLSLGNAYAQVSPEVTEQTTPESTMSVGISSINNARDAARFGQYTGYNKQGALLLDIELVKRDDLEGLWTTLTGRNLGVESRELSFSRQKQGDWRYGFDYNETVRYDPYVINTGMTGIGSTSPTINLIKRPDGVSPAWAAANGYTASNGVDGHDEQLKLKRTALGLSGDKWINAGLQLEVNVRAEEKKGARMMGRVGIASSDVTFSPTTNGNAGGNGALLLSPEPIDSVTKSIEARLNFNRGDLALSGGYYGSFYTNNVGSLSPIVPGTLNRGALWTGAGCTPTTSCDVSQIASAAVALPPDNQAHQFFASGTYAFTQATRANFKMSYTHATQDENFVGMGLTPSAPAPASLGGVVDTTLMQAGLNSRATKNLSINASVRYENRQDKTPEVVYNTSNSVPLNNTTNWASGTQKRTTAKVDGIYRLPAGYSANLGADWEHKDTPLPPGNSALFNNQVLFRSATNENGLHAALRKIMSETLNGSIGMEYKVRRGEGDWMTTSGVAGNNLVAVDSTTANRVLPDLYMDRDRSRVRGALDWSATNDLSLQAVLEHGHDFYFREGPIPAGAFAEIAGARIISTDALTLDATYKVSDNWRVNTYWTHSESRWKVNKASLADDTNNRTETVGLTMRGKVTPRLGIGMDFLMTNDDTTFYNVPATGNIAGFAGQSQVGNFLPAINYNSKKFSLYGIYDLDKKSAVRVNVVYQEFSTNDWQWGYNGVPFVYSDNTTVSSDLNRTLTFVGVTYIYKFQ
jgi:MtrB/PioB family decaheme-associated outer membrane protein